MRLPKQEYWSGLPFPPPGDLPNLRIKPTFPAHRVGSLPLSHLGSLPSRIRHIYLSFLLSLWHIYGFRKRRGTRDPVANIHWMILKAREFQKNIYFCLIDYVKAFDCVDHNKLWKILQEMGIPDHLTCLLRNLYAGQEATVRTEHGTTDWFQIGKGVHQAWLLSPCLFNLYAEYIMWNIRVDEA